MGSDGLGPRPWTKHQASTIFVRVPAADWEQVRTGVKTEFRGARGASSALWAVKPPLPVVAYTVTPNREHEGQLMVLENLWQEMLGAISDESLAREGVKNLAEFRRYWIAREKRRFRPTRMTWVYRIRPWEETDKEEFGQRMLKTLYGEWLDGKQ